jgi:cystathionine beta-lyase
MRRSLDTILAHAGRNKELSCGAVNVPVIRASTKLYENFESYERSRADKYNAFRYGRYGTPTTFALEEAVAELEGGYRAVAVPSGLAAISGALLGLLRTGDHLLMVDSVYGPARVFCDEVLAPHGITTTYYDPGVGVDIASIFSERTKVVYCESPGSLTFEIQDIPAIARAARQRNIAVIVDNTWATPYFFQAFAHGVNVSIHAATKYIVGHSDAMLGLIVASEPYYQQIRDGISHNGMVAGPDDCWLGLRGLRTLGVRLKQHQANALQVAKWLSTRPEVRRVMYPALPGDRYHDLWKQQFRGGSGLLGVELDEDWRGRLPRLVDSLELFGIGSSWGGYESLILPSKPVRVTRSLTGGPLLRLHVGLELADDLIADLDQAFASAVKSA